MSSKTRTINVAFGLWAAFGTFPTLVLANDAGLYDAPIPADKSLVRFLNVKLKSGVNLDFSGQKFEVDAAVLSNYRMIGNGSYKVSDGSTSAEANLEPGKYYTIAVGADAAGQNGIVVIADKGVENPSKSALSFYNFSMNPADLSLRLNGDTKVLFKDLSPAAMATKELPVIDIGLEVSEGGSKIAEVEKISLTAKGRQNVVVIDTANGPAGFVAATGIER
ncbi:alginate O-acetyltransferase AlgF [Rhizobium sp. MC63]|nr:alginate O-acetyltransferase AlgF [Rhizobium sp. MC63]